MSFIQLVPPNLGARDLAGRCLPYVQSVFGAPIMHDYARQAWDAAQHKHYAGEPPPQDVASILHFDHWGTYYSHSKGVWEYVNAGHIVVLVPGVGIFSSPTSGYGYAVFQTIAEIEQAFNSRYIGWTEDINYLRVIEPAPPEKEKDPMPHLTPLKTTKPRTIKNVWSALASKDNGSWDLLAGGDTMRRCLVHCNIDADGPLDVRAVIATTKNNGQTVTAVSATYYERTNAPFDTYVMPVDLPAGAQHRLRMQARATTGKPVTVRQVGNKTLHWEDK